MLDTDTKRRIDTARDILVGKVPDPKSQVEQITIALIYKFMDDMDLEAEVLGGNRKFFAGEYARYGWARLMRSGLGGHEALNLYAEAIAKMPENPGIPTLFRDIFKNALLPYRDPETLRAFLKIIDEFEYDHSERLGDAFEYLLSVLGSQGEAGQFRTPRHIIDFIVEVVDPKKTDTVLDPACGTAGFLISSFKHILKANTDEDGNSTLTPDELGRLAANFKGYDISPDMVRLSLANMYLHAFADPHIFEYDTLTSQDRWNEYADVILANPPFMSPKGGIKPHNRFSVQSKRSEVLFVDYIAEHLTPSGRAGIIVPEGIIFQNQTAYKQLRKMLVEEYLVAVVSLPAGVFNPYSGVKTSILILDKALAKQADCIAFFRINNDGYSLGAQRRPIDKDDLPQIRAEIADYLHRLRARESVDGFTPTLGLVVPKEKIAANGDYNLSGERYREGETRSSKFPRVALGEICVLTRGVVYNKTDEVQDGGVCVLRANNIDLATASLDLRDVKRVAPQDGFSEDKKLRKDDIFICLASGSKDHIGKVALVADHTEFYFGGFMGVIRVKSGRVLPTFLFHQLRDRHFNSFLRDQIVGANINNLSATLLYRFQIPLPPLEVQREIVAEIEGYQMVIDGARAVLDAYRPRISIDPHWPMARFGKVTSTITPPKKIPKAEYQQVGRYPVIDQSKLAVAARTDDNTALVDAGGGLVIFGDHTCAVKFVAEPFAQGADGIKIIKAGDGLLPKFVYFYLLSRPIEQDGYKRHFGQLRELVIPVPPLETQRAIVAELEAEQALVASNRALIIRFENKIQVTLAGIWREDEQTPSEA